MDILFDPEIWANIITLTVLEIVLGVDNLVFIAICAERLPVEQRSRARKLGLMMALITRLLLLYSIVYGAKLSNPLFTIQMHAVSIRDLVFIIGGLFLMAKATQEIHSALEGEAAPMQVKHAGKFAMVIIQIMIFDIIFSLDSIITAVGLSRHIWVMATAIVIAVILMVIASDGLSAFIKKYPTIKMLALAFLVLIGMVLVADGCGFHIPRGYIYFAIGFSIFVEFLNIRFRRSRT